MLTYIKSYLQTKYKLINPKLHQAIQNFSPVITHLFFVIGSIDLKEQGCSLTSCKMISNATYQSSTKFQLGWVGGQQTLDLYFNLLHKITITLQPLRGLI